MITRELKICNTAARRRAFKTKNIFIEDNTYGLRSVPNCVVILNTTSNQALARLLSNARACYDVRSVFEVHFIANTASFQRTKLFTIYLSKFQTVVTDIKFQKTFFLSYILTPRRGVAASLILSSLLVFVQRHVAR